MHLDAVRGMAAFGVLLMHWRDAFFLDSSELGLHNPAASAVYFVTTLGHQCVIVFFVLSGYLVGGSVVRSVNSGQWIWKSYLFTRLTRLYVVLLPALLLGGILDWTGMRLPGTESVYSGHSGMDALRVSVHSSLTVPTFVANCFFTQTMVLPGMGGKHVSAFGSNGPLWSLCNEFWYYLAFPLLALLLASAQSLRARVTCGIALVAWAWFVGLMITLYWIPWLAGVAIFFLPPFPSKQTSGRVLGVASALLLLGGGLVLSRLANRPDAIWPQLGADYVLSLAVAFSIWVTLHCATRPVGSNYQKLAQRSARSSYTLYLVHLPLLVFLKAAFHLPRAFPSWHGCLNSLALLLAIVVYAQLVYEVFEKHTDRVRAWIDPWVKGRQTALKQLGSPELTNHPG